MNLGKLRMVGEREKRFYSATQYNVYVTLQCECGSEPFVVAERHLPRRKNMHCGCEPKVVATRCDAHGKVGSSTYQSWASMKGRCLNPDDKAYAEYGAVGITVCDLWLKFKNFYADMGERPEGCTLNRIHGAKVYSKETCEWASLSLQAFDQKMKSTNTSGKTGVFWRNGRARWIVRVWKEGKTYRGGSYVAFEDAVAARVKLEEELYGFTKD